MDPKKPDKHQPKTPKKPITLYEPGSAIRGERVIARARKFHMPLQIVPGSSSHRIQQTNLEGTVLCIKDRPLNYLKNLPPPKDDDQKR